MSKRDNISNISRSAVLRSGQALKELPKAFITAEEHLHLRMRTFTRLVLATTFFWLSSIISLGATVTTGIAQSTNKNPTSKERRIKPVSRHRHHYRSSKKGVENFSSMSGTASWYGHGFNNRKTASGKRFDQDAFMAAHRSLPFGTHVRVTNLSNGKSCVVEITDRGPFVKNRIIDVSRGAAKELAFTDEGTAKVTLEVITPIDIASIRSHMRRSFPISDVLKTPAIALHSVPSAN